jgi:hypothetical protein
VSQPCGTYRVTGESRPFPNAQRRFPIPLLRAVDPDPRRRGVSERSTLVPGSPSPRRGSPRRRGAPPNAGYFPSPLPNRTRQALIPDSRSCPPFGTHIRSPMYHTRTVLSASRNDVLAIGRHRDASDRILVPREPPHFFPRRQLPQTHRFVPASRNDVFAIGRHRDAPDPNPRAP